MNSMNLLDGKVEEAVILLPRKQNKSATKEKRIPLKNLKKQLAFCLIVFCMGVWFLLRSDLQSHHILFFPNLYPKESQGFLISGPGCHIPDLDPNDPSIHEALEELEEPPRCNNKSSGVLVKSNLTHLCIDQQVLAKMNFSSGDLVCCYRPFWATRSWHHKYLNHCIHFREDVSVEDDFVRVECYVKNEIIYKDFYAFIPTSERSKGKYRLHGKSINVLILGIDALSRLNFGRQMTRTHDFLINQLNAVEFFGFNKVEDNTFPNIIPMLTGLSEKELIQKCWPNSSSFFDNCSFIWSDFKKAGYITGFGEDESWMGIFQYNKVGFVKQPTDIYLRVFNQVYQAESGHDKRFNTQVCVGPKMNIELLLDTVKKFVLRLKNNLSFGFFWENSLSHDYLNLPKYGDNAHVTLLNIFLENDVFNQSAVIIMSDHGIRWGKIRKTYQGYIEERLPLLIVSFPSWFKKKYSTAWANFKKNSHRLTTHFDLYETLKDLLNLRLLEDDTMRERIREFKEQPVHQTLRGISLFFPISQERTCEDADIADHWCTCHKDQDISTKDKKVIKCVDFTIDHINSLLRGYDRCSELRIESILKARVKVLPAVPKEDDDLKVIKGERAQDFTITFQAHPGGGIFEATVQYKPYSDTYNLMGTVTRSNTYGNSSYCVSHYKLKLYCYCKS